MAISPENKDFVQLAYVAESVSWCFELSHAAELVS